MPMKLTLKVLNAAGAILAQAGCDDEVFLIYRSEYAEGDRLVVETAESGHIDLSLDAGMPPARVFMAGTEFSLPIPSGLTLPIRRRLVCEAMREPSSWFAISMSKSLMIMRVSAMPCCRL